MIQCYYYCRYDIVTTSSWHRKSLCPMVVQIELTKCLSMPQLIKYRMIDLTCFFNDGLINMASEIFPLHMWWRYPFTFIWRSDSETLLSPHSSMCFFVYIIMLFLRFFFHFRQYNLHYLCCQVDLFAYVIFCVNVRLYSRMGLEQVSGAQEFSGNFKETPYVTLSTNWPGFNSRLFVVQEIPKKLTLTICGNTHGDVIEF